MEEYERISAILSYDPETGSFRWKKTEARSRSPERRVGSLDHKGYQRIWVDHKIYPAHHLAWFLTHRSWPKQIDHINGEKADNRIANLRLATTSQNSMNTKKRSDNTSGVKGVHWSTTAKKWCARVVINGTRTLLGHFEDIEDAARAYRDAAAEHYGPFARLD